PRSPWVWAAVDEQVETLAVEAEAIAQPRLLRKSARPEDLPLGHIALGHAGLEELGAPLIGLLGDGRDEFGELPQVGRTGPEVEHLRVLLVEAVDLDEAGDADDAPQGILQDERQAATLAGRLPDADVVALVAHPAEDAPGIVLDQPAGLGLVVERADPGDVAPGGRAHRRRAGRREAGPTQAL